MSDSEKETWDLYELCKLGTDYRKDFGLVVVGKETSVTIRPLEDSESIPISTDLQQKFDAEDRDEALEEAEDYVEENMDEGSLDMDEIDDEFMSIMEKVYDIGVDAEKTWPEHESSEAEKRKEFIKQNSFDGAVIEISMEILDLSGTLEDALKFPGRGRQ
jgi:hypothetical protein